MLALRARAAAVVLRAARGALLLAHHAAALVQRLVALRLGPALAGCGTLSLRAWHGVCNTLGTSSVDAVALVVLGLVHVGARVHVHPAYASHLASAPLSLFSFELVPGSRCTWRACSAWHARRSPCSPWCPCSRCTWRTRSTWHARRSPSSPTRARRSRSPSAGNR